MSTTIHHGTGRRIAYQRSLARLTQRQLAEAACIALGTVRKLERDERGASDQVLQAIAEALGIDPSALLPQRDRSDERVHHAMPGLSAAIAAYDVPDDGPVRPLRDLRRTVDEAVHWRLGAQYARIARHLPPVLAELCRALQIAPLGERQDAARLLVAAYRAADAVAFKFGARDLSARLVELMRWAAAQAQDPLLDTSVAYVRTETFFAARSYSAGLRALEAAIDASPAPSCTETTACRGALHMRAAVIAGRGHSAASAEAHLAEACLLAEQVPEGTYQGTAFGPVSVRIHEMSVAVSLGSECVQRVLDDLGAWEPAPPVPKERHSGFFIDRARAQLWTGQLDKAFDSLKTARRIAPQHTREHRWVREDIATLGRLKRSDAEALTSFARWCRALP
ncbi:helix-turn-helix domain-containing protein [Streptomyces gamaensis]|uniref:Helix-turn-helix domain-containing protein n=1 Tax=Streptomyces gamaensis TaxID=1763542 RepID=A0ABW0YTQ7_9ACTN